jgi:hypothetical protein
MHNPRTCACPGYKASGTNRGCNFQDDQIEEFSTCRPSRLPEGLLQHIITFRDDCLILVWLQPQSQWSEHGRTLPRSLNKACIFFQRARASQRESHILVSCQEPWYGQALAITYIKAECGPCVSNGSNAMFLSLVCRFVQAQEPDNADGQGIGVLTVCFF